MSGHRHPGVDAYISRLPRWQRDVCAELRELIHAADSEIEETITGSVRPYFIPQGNVCALLATRNHVDLFLYGPDVADPEGAINQGHGNATARAIQMHGEDAINVAAIRDLVRAIAERNRAGGWRKLRVAE